MLLLLPMAGAATPQQAINKPTRERVKSNDKDKKNTDKKSTSKNEDDKKNAAAPKKDDKKNAAAAAASKKDDKKDAATPKKDDKKDAATPKKDDKKDAAAANKDNKQATTPDSANKAAAKSTKKSAKPVNTETTAFDGIDVSHHQGYINWAELRKNSRIQYVYIRATVGSDKIDRNYKENVRNARKHGFKIGSYHYMTTLSSVRGQFENFRKMVDKNEQDILPMIDIEDMGRWKKLQLRDSLMAFAQLIEDYYGCKPVIYTYENFYRDNLGVLFESYPLFIAKYSNVRPDISTKAKWTMWQFSETGYFPAVKGNSGLVDLSRFNDGASINDILYRPSKTKAKPSVKSAVDHKEVPTSINATEQKTSGSSKQSSKQKTESKKSKENKAKEEKKKKAQEDAAKKAKEKEEHARKEAAKKEQQRAEQQRRERERQEAAQKAAADKAKRKADAQKARQEKAKQKASNSGNKSASMRGTLTQSQRNDSIRAAKQTGRKINKSSADND